MNEIDFANLVESVKQAGQIRQGKLGQPVRTFVWAQSLSGVVSFAGVLIKEYYDKQGKK